MRLLLPTPPLGAMLMQDKDADWRIARELIYGRSGEKEPVGAGAGATRPMTRGEAIGQPSSKTKPETSMISMEGSASLRPEASGKQRQNLQNKAIRGKSNNFNAGAGRQLRPEVVANFGRISQLG